MSMYALNLNYGGTCGTDKGVGTDGCLIGTLAATALSAGLLETHAQALLCHTNDGASFTDETTGINDATASDVEIIGATLAATDGISFGHATIPFTSIRIVIGVQGVYTTPVWAWKYWNGTAWTALSGLSDGTATSGTASFTAATGTVVVSYTMPTDWATTTVNSVEGYWIQATCTSVAGTTTQCELTQAWVIAPVGSGTWTDDTTDINDVGTADVALLPTAQPVINDAFYYGHASEKFCKIKLVTSTARTGTATLVWEYFNGTDWSTLSVLEDKSATYTATAGTHMISFAPPTDWERNEGSDKLNGNAGYFVRCRMTAFTSVTAGPVATQAWVYPLTTGAVGIENVWGNGSDQHITMNAVTASGTTADSIFLLVNCTDGTAAPFTWTKAVQADTADISLVLGDNDSVMIAQIKEDGTTEFADVSFYIL